MQPLALGKALSATISNSLAEAKTAHVLRCIDLLLVEIAMVSSAKRIFIAINGLSSVYLLVTLSSYHDVLMIST